MAVAWPKGLFSRMTFGRKAVGGIRYPVRNFRPVPLRPAFLLVFMLYICCLVVFLEYACRTFPTAENRRDIPNDPTSEYGPFISVPIIRAEATATASPADPAPENLSSPAPSRTDPTRIATATSTANATSKAAAPTSWTDLVVAPMKLGDRVGYPGLDRPMNLVYGKPSNKTSNSTSNSTSLHRRVPPPDNFGQISGVVQLLAFEFWTTDAYSADKSIWLRTDIFYLPWGSGVMIAGDEGSCQVVCDGPALVFLKPLCWSQWLGASSGEQAAMAQFPGAVRKINEQGLAGGVPCPKGPKAVVSVPATTRSVDAEIVGVTTANGLPSTFTTTRPIPVTGVSGLTPETTVLRDSVGRPTATSSRWVVSDLTLRDDKGTPTATVTARLRVTPTLVTLKDGLGNPTATVSTDVPLERSLITLKDADGRPTATIATEVPLVTGLVTLTDANGVPVATVTGGGASRTGQSGPRRTGRFDEPGLPSYQDTFHPINWGEYVLAAFVPVLVTVPLTILTQILRSEIRTLLPYNALTRQPNGATASESLCMNTGGLPGFVNSFRLLFRFKEPLAFLGDLLMLSSAVVVSFSSEAFGIKLYGACTADNFQGCHMGMAVFQAPSRVVQAFLGIALVSLFIMTGLLRYWRTGIDASGRSIAAIASLLGDPETRDALRKLGSGPGKAGISNNEVIRQLEGRSFILDPSPGSWRFNIVTSPTAASGPEQLGPPAPQMKRGKTFPLLRVFSISQSGDTVGQVAFLLSVVGFFVLIVYYESTILDTPFERFMDSQHFGVRVLFTSVGVVLSLFWDDYFSQVSVREPYRRLSRRAQPADNSILVSPPATAFTGLVPAALRRDVFVTLVALAAVLSKFTPILLANIPFSPWLTWPTHRACTWTAVGILGFMVLTLGYGLVFIKYPHMPVHPGTLAGSMYYVCDSAMLDDIRAAPLAMERTPSRRRPGRDGRTYGFGKMLGVSGQTRVGIDYAEASLPGEP